MWIGARTGPTLVFLALISYFISSVSPAPTDFAQSIQWTRELSKLHSPDFFTGDITSRRKTKLLRRDVPAEVQQWSVYAAWQAYVNSHQESTPTMPNDVPRGNMGRSQNGQWLFQYTENPGDCEETVRTLAIAAQGASGSSGTVYKAIMADPRQYVAIKITNDISASVKMVEGAEIQQAISSMNILRVQAYFAINQSPTIQKAGVVMDWINGGALNTHIGTLAASGQFALDDVFGQIVDGVRDIHNAGAMHRDIKPDNVLYDEGTAKIADFDDATRSTQASDWVLGTPGYAAPEIIKMDTYSNLVDVFSLGMIWAVMNNDWDTSDLQLFWKALIETSDGQDYNDPAAVRSILDKKMPEVDEDVRDLMADVLCGPSWRISSTVLSEEWQKLTS